MLYSISIVFILTSQYVTCQFGSSPQDFSYVTVREGAHMFYWLFYTTADVTHYTQRPLVVWLQGGPGGSSTGIGNFETLGPIDLTQHPRNYTWVRHFNVLFVDSPVGTGYSYVDDPIYLTTSNNEIALDLMELMRQFYTNHPEFNGIELYIFGQAYGGKTAVKLALLMREEEKAGTIESNLKGIGLGNAWIHPVDSTLKWGPFLLAAGRVDQTGCDNIEAAAREAERLFNEGLYVESTIQWRNTQQVLIRETTSIDYYNILTKTQVPDSIADTRSAYDAIEYMININDTPSTRQEEINLDVFMNTVVKQALGIPDYVTWGGQRTAVFDALREDFMKPVVEGIETLLDQENPIIISKYNGNLDIIAGTSSQVIWINRLRWHGADGYRNATRNPIWVNNRLEGYYKSYGTFKFFWINAAGHMVPRDSPVATSFLLQDMTSYG